VTAARYTVNAGRCIERDGKAFATIHGCGEYSPVELDQFADQVAAALNAQAAAASFDPVKENRKRVERTGRLLARYRLVTGDDPGDDVLHPVAQLSGRHAHMDVRSRHQCSLFWHVHVLPATQARH